MKKLPRYKSNSLPIQLMELGDLIDSNSVDNISKAIFGCMPLEINEHSIKEYMLSEKFRANSDYSNLSEDLSELISVSKKALDFAVESGFDQKLKINPSKFDLRLGGLLMEIFEKYDFEINPVEINDPEVQAFFTIRLLPHITFWRWARNGKINSNRFTSGNRNYFFTIMMASYLFDKGKGSSDRWEYLSLLSADNIVAIIERPGIGFRRGFAYALAEMLKFKMTSWRGGNNLDKTIRGVMKRATFTFAVSVMPEDREYYKRIVEYLFDWSEKNYVDHVNDEEPSRAENDNDSKSEVTHESNNDYISIAAENPKQSLSDESTNNRLSKYKPRFYIKKLNENELGYRNGVQTSGLTFYISKRAKAFFPELSKYTLNISTDINVYLVNYKRDVVWNYMYHNDKYNTLNGTRDELRIYLRLETESSKDFLKPGNIVVFERIGEKKYRFEKIASGSSIYLKCSRILKKDGDKGFHAIVDDI